ncbi:MAG TPA: HK97 family phage prohead protease [Planctomycetota bacterium]|nr:HK97 family phage prohead protease [Planctomycetota bacterium]
MDKIIRRQRDNPSNGLIYRQMALQIVRAEGDKPSNRIHVIASSDDMCDMGYYREQLKHDQNSIDATPAVSVLFNHDRNQVIGGILSTRLEGGKLVAELEIDPDVRGTNGLKLLEAIHKKYLRGVSIGYEYSREHCTFSEDDSGKRTVVVNRWTLREISITPTQADVTATVVRSVPDWAKQAFAKANLEESDMEFEKWLAARGLKSEDLTDAARTRLRAEFDAEVRVRASLATTGADEIKAEREKREKAERELAAIKHRDDMETLAKSHGVEWKKEDADGKTREQCVTLMLERKAKATNQQPSGSVAVVITRDAADKADEAAEDALGELLGVKSDKNLGMRGGSVLDIGRRWLAARGEPNILQISRREIAELLMGNGQRVSRYQRVSGRRDAANVTSGMFTSFLLANVMDKVVYNGFQASEEAITYPLWCADRQVMDFKQFTGAALDAGNLVETAENVAFPELAKGEGGYNATLGLWGATISLTLQSMQNDDLGEFMRWLRMAGFIAKRTVDVKVYTDLEGATWTSRTTVGDLTDDTLSANRASLSEITGPAGQKLGMTPRYLVVPSGLRKKALEISQIAPYIAPEAAKVNTDIIPIITPFLTTAGTPTQSKWYIAASKMFEPVVVATLQGVNAPIVEEYDPGAVAARKWKIMFPFKVVIPTVDSKVQAMWRGTNS